MKPRRILIFSLAYFPKHVGGAEVAVKEITDRLNLLDFELEMITLGDGSSPKEEQLGKIYVRRIFNSNGVLQKLAYPFAAYLKAKRLQNSNKRYDMVWAIMASYAGFAAFLFKRNFPNVPVVLNIQEGENFARRRGVFRPLFTKIFRSADYIHAISTYLSNWSKEMGATCRIDVIPNAVDYKSFSKSADEHDMESLRKKLGKREEDIFLITTSRLVEKNAVRDIILALQSLPKNVRLLVVGAGPLETELKRLALRLGLNYSHEPPINPGNRVHFLGYMEHKELLSHLQISDIFVRPSLSEGLGNSFLEAMAAGLPIIGTSVGGIPDFLKEGETGLFSQVHDPKSIASKVLKYIEDKELRQNIVKKAKALVKEKYQWDKIAEDMKKVFLTFKNNG